MRVSLARSTPLRLTILLGAAFLLALILAGALAFILIRQELSARVEASISDTFSVIRQSFGDGDIADLTASVQSHADATANHERVYLLLSPTGAVLAGNLAKFDAPAGWATVDSDALGLENDAQYRIFSGKAGGNTILVGTSSAETDAIGWLTLTSFGWAGLVFLALVGAAGTVSARRGEQRLDIIARTMARIGRGELTARIPISPASDDIDNLSAQMNVALDRLSSLVEGMRQVSMDIAHDLKTPLNRLAITVEAAIRAEKSGLPALAHLEQAQEESRQINVTFDALLRIAQIEAGARRARFVALPLEPLLRNIWELYVDHADQLEQTLEILVPAGLPPVLGDRELLTQMFANLVENTIRHCPAGTRIHILASVESGRVDVRIADNGPGIPDEERERVFRRLYRLDKSRATPGSGLGLSLVKAVADLHGASIALEDSEPGLRVHIIFPPAPNPR